MASGEWGSVHTGGWNPLFGTWWMEQGEYGVEGNFLENFTTAIIYVHGWDSNSYRWTNSYAAPKRGYLGIRFKFDETAEDFHYGWVDLRPGGGGNYTGSPFDPYASLKIFAHAWQTIPGRSIYAGEVPEPTSLGLLALGSLGVLARRRRKAERGKAEAAAVTA